MIPDCDRQTVRRSDGRTESIMAKTALCIASYADVLSKMARSRPNLHRMVSKSGHIQDVLEVKVKVKGHRLPLTFTGF